MPRSAASFDLLMKLAVVFFFAIAAGCEGVHVETTGMTAVPATVVHYDYAVNLNLGTARSRLKLVPSAAGGQCLDLQNQSHIQRAILDGQPASFREISPGAYRFCSPSFLHDPTFLETEQALVPGTQVGTHGGYFQTEDGPGGRFIYLSNWVGDCGRLGPCDPTLAALSSFVIEVTHRADEVVLCPGLRQAQQISTRCVIDTTAAPIYSGLAVLARTGWQPTTLIESSAAKVVVFETAEHRLSQLLDKAELTRYIDWLGKLLGPLPYGRELRIAAAPITWLGYEHPANIVLREDLDSDHRTFANPPLHVLLHEIAHQWAGNRTTLVGQLDFAWKEAVAEYLAYVYEEQYRPQAEAQQTRSSWRLFTLLSVLYARPLSAPVDREALASNANFAGPMLMFLQLELLVTRATLLSALQAFLREPGARSVADWQRQLERTGGVDLNGYFKAWIYGDGFPEWPRYAVKNEQSASTVSIEVQQSNLDHGADGQGAKPFPCIIPIRIHGSIQDLDLTIPFGFGDVPKKIIDFQDTVLSVSLDPENQIVHW